MLVVYEKDGKDEKDGCGKATATDCRQQATGSRQQATGDPLERACEFRSLIMTILVKIRYE